jgi:UDP-N-acetylglucosamine 2-epimerase (non-hydrolysing)/GDP/UDP-N,N'-diacetylbacillosamine 2-epimerase (hydrolysing)
LRTIGVVTVARSDYGIYLPLLGKIQANPELRLHLIVSGMHLSPEFGLTVKSIEADGFEVGDRVEMLLSSDTPQAIAKSMGLGTIGFAQSFARFRPDILVVLGDRFEMHAAALAALPFKIPIAHIHGGEVTRGAIDDALRHSITKLSHVHFVATEDHARRVIQLGEEPWRVTVCGALSLDNLRGFTALSKRELEARYGLLLDQPPLLVTFHPVTLEYERSEWQVEQLLAALEACRMPVVFTLPNADTNGRQIARQISDYVQTHTSTWLVDNLGTVGYFSMMAQAAAMVGNSSSGIIEAASFKLPVVNIGTRQQGRLHPANVIDVGYTQTEIVEGIKKVTQNEFRDGLRDVVNPYGCGQASDKIIQRLQEVVLGDRLLTKSFYDVEVSSPTGMNVEMRA